MNNNTSCPYFDGILKSELERCIDNKYSAALNVIKNVDFGSLDGDSLYNSIYNKLADNNLIPRADLLSSIIVVIIFSLIWRFILGPLVFFFTEGFKILASEFWDKCTIFVNTV